MPRSVPREIIDIESLLVRAYREKQVDRMMGDTRRSLGIRGPARYGASAMARGERVDTSSYGASAEADTLAALNRLLSAGDGLLAAHDLVLALDDYFLEDHGTPDLAFTLWTADGALDAGQFIEEARYGGADTIQAATVAREIGPEGERVTVAPIAGARQRRVHKIVVAPLIVVSGRRAEAPYVSPVEIERMRKIPAARKQRATEHEPVYVTPLDVVVRERAEYAAWHASLCAIAAQLADLEGLTITMPTASARPWEGEAMSAAA